MVCLIEGLYVNLMHDYPVRQSVSPHSCLAAWSYLFQAKLMTKQQKCFKNSMPIHVGIIQDLVTA